MPGALNNGIRSSGIVVATSIPPNVVRHDDGRDVGQEYQRHCVETWIEAGFRVLSLNFSDEIAELAPRYPKVDFIAVNRDKRAIFDNKGPLLSDLLRVLSKQTEDIVGIINADIALEAKDWVDIIRVAAQNAIAVAHRADVPSLGYENAVPYRNGYDLFFFERKKTPEDISDQPFSMGLPWWDYWLPIAFRLQGLQVNLLTSPRAFHLQHPANYKWSSWNYMAKQFAEWLIESVAARPDFVAPDPLVNAIKLCRDVVAVSIFEAHANRTQLAEACLAAISQSSSVIR